ncbi:arginase family protein [Mammaliicoccus sciuri]|uniref:arginase family protein n=1 Tax=Mammaliicoccus sciuri TaxID=1296 RepID=UPI0034DD5CCF
MKKIKSPIEFKSIKREFILLNIPFDSNSRIPGAKISPSSILNYIHHNKALYFDNLNFYYNLSVLNNRIDLTFFNVEDISKKILSSNNKIFMIGGDHSLTYPIVKTLNEFSKFTLVVLDAHHDSHVSPTIKNWSFIRNLSSIINEIVIIGNREHYTEKPTNVNIIEIEKILLDSKSKDIQDILFNNISNRNIYLSIDIDVLDPAYFPGVSYPLIGGLDYITLKYTISLLFRHYNVLSLDLVEFNPMIEEKLSTTVMIQLIQHIDRSIKYVQVE